MKQINKLKKYCQKMLLDYEIEEDVLSIQDKLYKIITDDNKILFDEELNFLSNTADEFEDGYVYEFGGRWYLQNKDEGVTLTELCYIGRAREKLPTKSFLGIRSSYELMNGLGLYEDWVKKAKFLGVETLGICEKATLSGVLVFQNECEKKGIKSIIGMTIPVKGIREYDIKLYVKNFQGWLNLLKFNTILNVDGEPHIKEQFLIDNRQDLFIVADPKSIDFHDTKNIVEEIDYYQLDTVRFINEEKDAWYIDNLERFICSGNMKPISITDAFYLEQEDYRTREVIWAVAKAFDDKTNNQYFKSKGEYATEFLNMFEDDNKSWIKIYKEAISNEAHLIENCNFKYDTDTRHLPKYVMTEEEASQYNTNEELFMGLIKKGFKEKGIQEQVYIDRLKIEIEVLRMGDVIDYFLALHDIVRQSKQEGFLTGIGRGSAGGSLIAYLLGIIQIDPLEFDLLFERFLNSGRMGEYRDKPMFTLTLEDGSEVKLAEGALVRVLRDGKEKVIFIHEIKEGDDLIKY